MAPSAPTGQRLIMKGMERKRPGPAPKPLSERLKNCPPKQVKRVERSYTRERKIEVLVYLLNHRVPDARARRVPRRRIGQPYENELTEPMVQEENGEFVWYRAPTYAEASDFWKIPTPTIQGWWDSRKKLLEGTGIALPEVGPGGFSATLAATGASAVPNRAQTTSSTTSGEAQQRDGVSPADNGAAPATPPGPAPSPNPQNPPASNGTPLAAVGGTSSANASGTQPSAAAQPTPTGPGRQPIAANGTAAPVAQRPLANVARPTLRPAPHPAAPKRVEPAPKPTPLQPLPAQNLEPQAVHVGPPSPAIPPVFNPANYVVVYIGPQPGPSPGQHCIHPGAILPVVYSGQPIEVPPMSFVSVFPSHPPGPGPQAPPPPPDATYIGGAVFPDHHLPHGPYPPASQGQPAMPHGAPPTPDPGQPAIPHGAHRPSQRPYLGPAGYASPYASPSSSSRSRQQPHPVSQAAHTERLLAPAVRAQPTTASSGPPPTPTTIATQARARRAGPPSPRHRLPVAPPGQHPAQNKSLPAPAGPSQQAATTLATPQQVPPGANAADTTTTAVVSDGNSPAQEQEGERTDAAAPDDQGPSSPSAEDVSRNQGRDAAAAGSASPSSGTGAACTSRGKESAMMPMDMTTVAPEEKDTVTPMETTGPPDEDMEITPIETETAVDPQADEDTATPMEASGTAEAAVETLAEPAATETLAEQIVVVDTATPMEIDTEAPAEPAVDTPGVVASDVLTGSPFGSGVLTPAPLT